ncbi:hypothetical protein MRX96_009699 [Rhipicephalus microplus]
MLVGSTWTEQDHIAYIRMVDQLSIGYLDDLSFCNIDLAQMKPLKEPLRVKKTMVISKGTVCWVTVETNRNKGNVILHTGTGKKILFHVEDGVVEIPMLNDKDEDKQQLKGSLLAHGELLAIRERRANPQLLVRLKEVLYFLRAAGITLKISKSVFESDEIDHLGFKIVKGDLQPGEVKQQAILDARTPTDVHSNLITEFELPECVISDHGSSLKSHGFEAFCQKNGVAHIVKLQTIQGQMVR